MNKIIVLVFIIILLMLGMELFRFAFISANGGYFIGFWWWYAILACKILFIYLLATRVDQFVHVAKATMRTLSWHSLKKAGRS